MFGRANKRGSCSNQGFTIVELLVVIVIIGILAAITIVSYVGMTAKANGATIQSDLATNAKKLAMYYTQYGEYPHINSLTGCPEVPSTVDSNYCLKFSSGNEFTYAYGSATTYELTATKDLIAYKVTESTAIAQIPPDTNWITIGTQRWAKANLNVGTRIAGNTAQTNNGGTNVIEKYCYGDTDAGCTNMDSNGNVYGALYRWDEAMNYSTTEGAQGICPAGSHIPSDNDWKILEVSLGMTQAQADAQNAWRGTDQGTKLKSGGSSGLNVPFAGYRDSSGFFSSLSSQAYLWSSSGSAGYAWKRSLFDGTASVERSMLIVSYGFSVRCLKN